VTAAQLLFPFGMRLTTWIVLIVFVALAVRRRDSRFLGAAAAWLLGFEAAFDLSRAATGYPLAWQSRSLPVVVGVFTVAWFAFHELRPSGRWLAVTALIWSLWLADGFPVNYHTLDGFQLGPEIMNVSAKTALAVAYLVPLLGEHGVWGRRRSSPSAVADSSGYLT
jgi:hypothetical protein